MIQVVILTMALFASSIAVAEWSGDVTDETIVGRPYGLVTGASKSDGISEVKLVCFEEDSFWLYLDNGVSSRTVVTDIIVTVDDLPPIDLVFQRKGENYTVTNQTNGFWNLIAQMSAGAVLRIEIGGGKEHLYSLRGFTQTYLDSCSWVEAADSYRFYLDRYR